MATTGYGNTVGEDGKWPVRVWTTEPDVSGTGQAPTGYQDTYGEAASDLFAFGMPTPTYPRDSYQVPGHRLGLASSGMAWPT